MMSVLCLCMMTIVSCLTSAINLINPSITVRGLINQVVRNSLGDKGCQNNFAASCMLQNVFNTWFQVNDIDSQSVDFGTNCLMLSNETFAITLAE